MTGSGSGADRNYPSNRGLYINSATNCFLFVNDQEHIRLITKDDSGDILAAFSRFAGVHDAMKRIVENGGGKLAWDPYLGFLNSSLIKLGSAATCASAIIRLKELGATEESLVLLDDLCFNFNTRFNQLNESGLFEIVSEGQAGHYISEVEIAQQLLDCVHGVLDFDDQLVLGVSIDDANQRFDDLLDAHRNKMSELAVTVAASSASSSSSSATAVAAVSPLPSSLSTAPQPAQQTYTIDIDPRTGTTMERAAFSQNSPNALVAAQTVKTTSADGNVQQLQSQMVQRSFAESNTASSKTMQQQQQFTSFSSSSVQQSSTNSTLQSSKQQQTFSYSSTSSSTIQQNSSSMKTSSIQQQQQHISKTDDFDPDSRMPPISGKRLSSPAGATAVDGKTAAAAKYTENVKRASVKGTFVDRMVNQYEGEGAEPETTPKHPSSSKLMSYMNLNDLVTPQVQKFEELSSPAHRQ